MIPNLSKDMIHIMQQLRKRLRSEFNEDIRLSSPDVIEQLIKLVEKSHDPQSLLLFADLEDMMGLELSANMNSELHTSHSEQRMSQVYQGQFEAEPPAPSEHTEQIKKRIYRGQVVA